MKLTTKIYDLLILITGNLQSLFLLAIRVTWGWQFFQTGKGKLGNIAGVTDYFTSLHIPMPKLNAIMAGSTECFGGLLLIAGLGGRLVSVPLTFTMLVAYWTAERPDIHNMDDFVKAAPFAFLFTVLVVMLFGPGRFSIDYLIQRSTRK
jgi:putative oxidoreductase